MQPWQTNHSGKVAAIDVSLDGQVTHQQLQQGCLSAEVLPFCIVTKQLLHCIRPRENHQRHLLLQPAL